MGLTCLGVKRNLIPKGLEDRKFLKEVMQSGGHRGGLLACEIAEKALQARGLQE